MRIGWRRRVLTISETDEDGIVTSGADGKVRDGIMIRDEKMT